VEKRRREKVGGTFAEKAGGKDKRRLRQETPVRQKSPILSSSNGLLNDLNRRVAFSVFA
jgi:hypothetical protein